MLPSSPPRPLNVLVVGPCPDTTISCVLLLGAWGHAARAANTARAALAAAEESSPDVVLIEPTQLGVDGYEVARRLKETGHDGRPVVVAVSGRCDGKARARARAAGCDLYLTDEAGGSVAVAAVGRPIREAGR